MIDPTKVLEIARVNLLRQVRDRTDLFFVFVLPTIIVVALGLQFGGVSRARLGVVAPVGDAAAAAVVASLEEDGTRFDVRRIADEATLRLEVERGLLEAGVVIPDGFEARPPRNRYRQAGVPRHHRGVHPGPAGAGGRRGGEGGGRGDGRTRGRDRGCRGLVDCAGRGRAGVRDRAGRGGLGDAGRGARPVRGLLPVHDRGVLAAHPVHVPHIDDRGHAARLRRSSSASRGGWCPRRRRSGRSSPARRWAGSGWRCCRRATSCWSRPSCSASHGGTRWRRPR